jgi:hypothetical protein
MTDHKTGTREEWLAARAGAPTSALTAARPPGRPCQRGRADARSPRGRAWTPGALTTSAPAMTALRPAAAAALTATLGLAAACWVVSVWQMTGTDLDGYFSEDTASARSPARVAPSTTATPATPAARSSYGLLRDP